jgi:hypothetical protein
MPVEYKGVTAVAEPEPASDPGDSLAQQLAAANEELEAAKRALGAAAFDGTSAKAAQQRVAVARDAIEVVESAKEEAARRIVEREVKRRAHEHAIAQWRYLCWYRDYAERVAPVLRAREQLRQLEERVMVLHTRSGWLGEDANVIQDEVNGGELPHFPEIPTSAELHGQGDGRGRRAEVGTLSPEQLEAVVKQLSPAISRKAKEIGADAKPENLPWPLGRPE